MAAGCALAIFACGCGSSSDSGAGADTGVSANDAASDGDGGVRVCDPSAPSVCDGASSVKICRPDGSGYDTSPCSGGAACTGGVCGCAPKSSICQGQDVATCGADGKYTVAFTCPKGTVCTKGHCDDARCPDELTPPKEVGLPINAWPRYRHDNRNSGWTPAIVADAPKLKWKVFVGGTDYDLQKGLGSGAVVNQDNVVFVGAGELDGKNGQMYSFDATGKPLWSYPANRMTGLSTPAVRKDGTSYVASGDSNLLSIKPDGTLDWKYKTGLASDGDPIVTREGTLVYPSDDKSLYALDPTGKLVWQSSTTTGPGEVDAALAETCDGKIVAGGGNGWAALDIVTGKPLWLVPATGTYECVSSSPNLTADGTMYGVDMGGVGYAIDVATGKVLWSKNFGVPGASTPARIGSTLYVVLNDGNLHAIDAASGAEIWSKPVGYALTRNVGRISGPVIDGNMRLYVNSTDGYVHAFDTTGKELWKIAASGKSAAQLFSGTIAIGNDGTMYVPGNDGTLYVFQ